MDGSNEGQDVAVQLRAAVVLSVAEDACEVSSGGPSDVVAFAPAFPTPRVERVSPGHLVAVASTPGAADVVVWRWFDAVVLGTSDDGVRLWEPGHGEVVASARAAARDLAVGSRAYASAGLPGADWWVAGPVVPDPGDADVELDEVDRLYRSHDLWRSTFSRIDVDDPGDGPVTFEDHAHARGPFFHGTKAVLEVGDVLAAGYGSNFQEGRVSNHVYFAARLEAAVWGAELSTALAGLAGRGHVYRVEPLGPFEDDPNVTDKKFPGNPTRSYRTRDGLRVVAEVDDWEGHPPEQLAQMLANLEQLREQGLDVIED